MKKPRKSRFRFFRRFLLLLVLLVVGLLSPPGLRLITPLLENRLSAVLSTDVTLEGLHLSLPLSLRLERLTLQKGEAPGIDLQDASLRLSLSALLSGQIRIRRLLVRDILLRDLPFGGSDESDLTEAPPLTFPDLTALFETLRVDVLRLDSVRLAPPLVPEAMKFEVTGQLREYFLRSEVRSDAVPKLGKLAIRLHVVPEGSRLRLQAEGQSDAGEVKMEGSVDAFTNRAELQALLRVPGAGEEVLMAELRLEVSPDSMDLRLDFPEISLRALGLRGSTHPDARLRGHLHLEGAFTAPSGELKLDFTGLRPESPDLWDGPPARILASAQLKAGRLTSEFRLENLPGDPMVLRLDLPVQFSLYPFHAELPEDQPLSGEFRANTDLEGLARLAVLDVYHRFSGAFVAEAQLNGTLAAPRLDGQAALRNGRYEHELLGLLLRNVELSLSAQRDALVIDHLRASDGGAGRVELSGRLGLNPAEPFSFELTMGLQDFRVIRHDLADVTARGDLQWTGGRGESLLRGSLHLNPVELRIPERLPQALVPLEVVEIHAVSQPKPPEANEPGPGHRVRLEVSLEASDRIFVRGRGLDSEWSARLRVTGDSRGPKIVGLLEVLRGRFVFFGKRLLLTRGRVQFDGVFPPEPLLDVAAELRGGGILAILQVRGPAADPEMQLSSSPLLPEDEILARLLFGRESARITPWQALTLAQALNRLRGGGSAIDLMGETRRILRVDQVEVLRDDEAGDTSIKLGKYISDRIYVEVERGIGAEGGRARVEVELTPALRLETETGGQTDTGVGIIWTRDF